MKKFFMFVFVSFVLVNFTSQVLFVEPVYAGSVKKSLKVIAKAGAVVGDSLTCGFGTMCHALKKKHR